MSRRASSTNSGRVHGVASKLHPMGDRVVVKPSAKEEITKSGIVIPDTAKEKPMVGTVVAVGAGKISDKGERIPIEVKEGDKVLFAKYGGTEYTLDGEDLLVLRESDILAVLSE
ncbi:MAG TPA: co-chaperone GroES [Ktedonobacterales bacterium]